MDRQSWRLWPLFVLALLLFGGSAAASYQEIVPYLGGSQDIEAKRQMLSIAPPPAGLSLQAQRLALDDCSKAVRSLTGVQATEEASRIVLNCRSLSEDMVRQAPLFSYAWYVVALTYAFEGAGEPFQHALSQSQATTANQWALASLRLRLAVRYWAELTPAIKEQMEADIRVVATVGRGRTWLAQQYVENTSFGEDVVASLEQTPANIQRAFISAVSSLGATQ